MDILAGSEVKNAITRCLSASSAGKKLGNFRQYSKSVGRFYCCLYWRR